MKSRYPLKIDLNNLFKPAMLNGLEDLSACEALFKEAHPAIMALKRTGQLVFSNLPEDEILLNQVLAAAKKYADLENVVVLGIGGSALGALSVYRAIQGCYAHESARAKKQPRLFVVDNIDPLLMNEVVDCIKGQKNLFVLISKSGNTSETLAQYLFFREVFPQLNHKDLFIITDTHDGFLRKLAKEQKIASLPVPAGVGGRFSVFSPVGLFPLALCGIKVDELLSGAHFVEEQCRQGVLAQNPAALLATTLYTWCTSNKISQIVMMPYSSRLRLFADWFSQLWAESLGKEKDVTGKIIHAGSTPVKSLGVTDQHSQLQLYLEGPLDKVVCFLEVEDPEVRNALYSKTLGDDSIDFLCGKNLNDLLLSAKAATEESLTEKNRPNFSLRLSVINEYQLGQLYQLFMNVIPYMGVFMNINAFDQPAVERIKKFTFGLMGKKKFEDFAEKIRDRKKRNDLIF